MATMRIRPPGPSLPEGSTVNWEYEITNTGADDLINIAVTDDQGVSVSCPGTTLAPGASMICTASGAAQLGQYSNVGTVTATTSPGGQNVLASDASHYYGQSLRLVKRTNGIESNGPPGPTLSPGDAVTWTYEVTNPGPATVSGLSVTDDQGVVVSCPQTTLASAESVVCTGTGIAQAGQYANIGTATATLPLGGTVTGMDASYYFGNPIHIEKSTNGVDADLAPGPSVAIGSTVNWTYLVTNNGVDTMTAVTVTDDQGVVVTCPSTTLNVGQSMTCTASGVAVAGQYANTGTVDATSATDGAVSASDPSHYFGQTEVLDFGDAPDPTYQALFASDGARHVLGGGVFLGACVDAEADALTDATALGDDTNTGTAFGVCSTPGDDEDGVTFTSPVEIGLTASVDVVASAPCTLSAWIDFQGDGDWGEADDDLFPGGTALAAGTNSLTFAVPSSAVAGSTHARFRCTTDGAVGFTGQASDGEVEDYAVSITVPPPAVSATKAASVAVDADSNSAASPGDTLEYTITITNSGNGAANGVTFNDTPDPNTSLVAGSVTTSSGIVTSGNTAGDTAVGVDIGTIPPAGAVTITFRVSIASPAPTGITSVANQGSTSGTNFATVLTDDPAAGGPSDPTTTALTITPVVTASKSDALVVDADSDGSADPGDQVRYTIIIANNGNGDALGVAFNDTPDPNTALVAGSVTTTGGAISSGNTAGDTSVAVNVGAMPAGSTTTITFDVTIDNPFPSGTQQVTNSGTVTGSNFATVTTDDPAFPGSNDPTVTPVTAMPIVSASKTDVLSNDANSNGIADPGDRVLYTITIANNGDTDALGVTFNDSPDSNSALVAGSVTTTSGSIVSGNTGGDTSVSVNVGTMPAGSTTTLTFDVTVDDPFPSGVQQIANTGTVSGSNFATLTTDDPALPGGNDATVTPVTAMPIVSASKTDVLSNDANSNGIADPGDRVLYTIDITNSGNTDALGVAFNDFPDSNSALVTGSVTTTSGTIISGNTAADTSVSVDIAAIPAGTTTTITFEVTIDDPFPSGVQQIANTGTVSGSNFATLTTDDPALPGSNDATVTPVTAMPIVSATKTAVLSSDVNGNGIAEPGDHLLYTITIANNGNTDALGVQFNDTPDSHTTIIPGTVTTSLGTVTSGNTPGDSSVAVDVGTLPVSAPVTIEFEVSIGYIPAGVTSVTNSGTVSGSNFPSFATDSPAAPGSTDPTVFAVAAGVPIPLLDRWGLLALSMLLGLIAIRRSTS